MGVKNIELEYVEPGAEIEWLSVAHTWDYF